MPVGKMVVMKLRCEFCGGAIREGARHEEFRAADGKDYPMHIKCYRFAMGWTDGTEWDIH